MRALDGVTSWYLCEYLQLNNRPELVSAAVAQPRHGVVERGAGVVVDPDPVRADLPPLDVVAGDLAPARLRRRSPRDVGGGGRVREHLFREGKVSDLRSEHRE